MWTVITFHGERHVYRLILVCLHSPLFQPMLDVEGRIYNLPKELKSMNSTETALSSFSYANCGVW
jgi:hypothetical protein